MDKKLQLFVTTLLLVFWGGIQNAGADTLDVYTLADAKVADYTPVRVNLPENKVQILYKEDYTVYLWDGSDAYRVSGSASAMGLGDAVPGQYINGILRGYAYTYGYSSAYMYAETPTTTVTLGEVAPLLPKTVTDVTGLTNAQYYDLIKVEGEFDGDYFVMSNGRLQLPYDYEKRSNFDHKAYDGSRGFLTGMYEYSSWSDSKIFPISDTPFDEEVVEINTKYAFDGLSIAGFKSLADEQEGVANGVIGKLRLSSSCQIVNLVLSETATVVDIWNGKDGIRIEGGKALYDIFKDAQVGQRLKGYIIGRTRGNADSKVFYDSSLAETATWDVTDAADITLGDLYSLSTLDMTFSAVETADLKKGDLDYLYVKFVGVADFDADNNVVLYNNKSKTSSVRIDFTYFTPDQAFDQPGKIGDAKGLLARNAAGDGFVLYALAADYFEAAPECDPEYEVNGISEFRELVARLEAENAFGKQVRINLTNAQLLYHQSYGYNTILWDGKAGMKVQGGDAVNNLFGSVSKGQTVSGYIIGMAVLQGPLFSINEYVAGDTNRDYDVRTAADLTFGEVRDFKPYEVPVTFDELGYFGEKAEDEGETNGDDTNEDEETVKIDLDRLTHMYIKMYCRVDSVVEVSPWGGEPYVSYYLVDVNDTTKRIAPNSYGELNMKKYIGKTGYAMMWCEKNTYRYNDDQPYFYLTALDNDFFYVPVTELTLDASASAESNAAIIAGEHESLVKVTVNNLALTTGNWNTLCLPFDITKEQMDGIFGEDTKLYTLTSVDKADDDVMLNFTNALTDETAIVAGHPYLIWPAQNVTAIELDNVAVKPGIVPTTVDTEYVLTGTFDNTELTKGSDFYFNDGAATGYFSLVTDNITMLPFSAYVTAPEATTALNIAFDGVATGIDNVNMGGIATESRVYNLNGQYVGNSLRGLTKGVYVSGGKKIVVK